MGNSGGQKKRGKAREPETSPVVRQNKDGDSLFEKLWFGLGRTGMDLVGLDGTDVSMGTKKRYRSLDGKELDGDEFVKEVIGGRTAGPDDVKRDRIDLERAPAGRERDDGVLKR